MHGGRRHLGQPPIRLQEAVQGSGAGFNDVESALKIRVLLFRQLRQRQSRSQASGNRNDGRQRVVKLVHQNADQALRSSSRRARLTSESTISLWGTPFWRKELWRTIQRALGVE